MPYKTFPPIVAVKSSATGALSCARASTVPLPPALPTEPASLGFGGGPIVGEWGAYPLIGLMPHKTFGFAGAPDITQMGRRSPPISRFLLRKKCLAPLRGGAALPRGQSSSSQSPLITAFAILAKAASAPLLLLFPL